MDHLKNLYLAFRPMFGELSKLNIDFTKKASKIEIEQFKDWVNKNMSELVSEPSIVENFFYDRLQHIELVKINGDSREIYLGRKINLNSALNELKKGNKEIDIIWILKESGAALNGFPISDEAKMRSAIDKFNNLMDMLNFQDNTKKIFSTKDGTYFRFNAIICPEDFFHDIYPHPKGFMGSEKKVIAEHYKVNDWLILYDGLCKLLQMWKNSAKKSIDFIMYRKTTEIFLKLIPVIMEDGTLKCEQQYYEDRLIVKKAIYEYYKKQTLCIKDQCIQEIDELSLIVKNINKIFDLINMESINKLQKEVLMDEFIDIIQIEGLYQTSERLIRKIKDFQKECSKTCIPEPNFEDYKKIWHKIWTSQE